MNTEKKNQHYLPKFYLRNFSYEENKKQIGIFNIHKELYYQTASLKNQGSKKFFYGYDGEVEDRLSNIEGYLSRIIQNIITKKNLPKKNTQEHIDILTFIGLTHLRNPISIENIKGSMENLRRRVVEIDPNADIDNMIPIVTHEKAIKIALSNLGHLVENIEDLDFKLLLNCSNTPFITSDFPIIKYNQYLEERNWIHGKTGYGNTGLQIYLPLNPSLAIILYDSQIYKVGYSRNNFLELFNISDIDQLNMLQLLNCFDTVFFQENISEHYIRSLFTRSKKFTRANIQKSSIHDLVHPNQSSSNLVIISTTDSDIHLKISGIKKSSRANGVKLHPSIAQLRKKPAEIRKRQEFN